MASLRNFDSNDPHLSALLEKARYQEVEDQIRSNMLTIARARGRAVIRDQTPAERAARLDQKVTEELIDQSVYVMAEAGAALERSAAVREMALRAEADARRAERAAFRAGYAAETARLENTPKTKDIGPTLGYRFVRRFVRPFMSNRRWLTYVARHFEKRES